MPNKMSKVMGGQDLTGILYIQRILLITEEISQLSTKGLWRGETMFFIEEAHKIDIQQTD